MKYHVFIEDAARSDLEAITLWLAQHSESAAGKWYRQVREAIQTLDTSPFRCPLAPEDEAFEEEIRHLLYGRRRHVYRILFTIRDKEVHVLHIRHGSRTLLSPGETGMKSPMEENYPSAFSRRGSLNMLSQRDE